MKTTNLTPLRKGSVMIVTFTILILASTRLVMGQQDQTEIKLTKQEKMQVVDSICKFMADKYVFPDMGKKMGDLVTKNLKDGAYDIIDNPQAFASKLTEDLRTVNNDRHIGVQYEPEYIAMMKKAMEDKSNKELEEYEKRQREYNNFNFREVKILPGNVGYLKFNSFQDASIAGPTAVAAMNFLAHTDALIIDLTDNGGGSPSLIQLITTYFFEEPEHLNSFYIREGDKTEQFWTLPYVPGPKMTNTDIYILTSGNTFSGAEEFTYNLKNLKRATIVGETTGGGAHPVDMHIINDHFGISVPFGRAINPITNTNWEGTGVEPDIKIQRDKAKETAYLLALDKRLEKEQDKEIRQSVAWTIDGIKAKQNPVTLEEKTLKLYVGDYGPRKITLEEEQLYYQRENRPKMKMIPMKEDMFMFDDIDYFRVKFIRDGDKIVALEGNYDNGTTDRNDKS
jgi:retinol-binding protein 3